MSAWSSLKTEAIVLTSVPFKETDRRYSALTRDFGKVQFIGRGARKGAAKLAAHLEPFAIVDLEIIKGRRTTTVISVERQRAFRSIMQDLDRRLLAQTGLILVDQHLQEFDVDESLYHIVLDWLDTLDKAPCIHEQKQLLLLGGFLLRILQQLGYEVSLRTCISCKSQILPFAFRWHPNRGGLVCSQCVQTYAKEFFAARSIKEEALTLMRMAREDPYESILHVSVQSEHVRHFAQMIYDMMRYHLPIDSPEPFWRGIGIDK